MLLSKESGRGRPKTLLINRLRVSLWSHRVLLASGLNQVQDLESLLRKRHRISLASGLWSRYMRGEVVPQGALAATPGSLVLRITKAFPQTGEVFYTPLWDLLSWAPAVDLNWLKSIYLNMDEGVHIHFVARTEVAGQRTANRHAQFWHMKKSLPVRKNIISSFGLWDSIILNLLEARMGYAAQSMDTFIDCQLSACRIIADLARTPEFKVKRLQGVALIMEAMCLDSIWLNVVTSTLGDDKQVKARDLCISALNNWMTRCNLHIRTLSKNSGKVFLNTLKDDTKVGKGASGMGAGKGAVGVSRVW